MYSLKQLDKYTKYKQYKVHIYLINEQIILELLKYNFYTRVVNI